MIKLKVKLRNLLESENYIIYELEVWKSHSGRIRIHAELEAQEKGD